MIKEVAERVKHLGLGNPQCFGDFQNTLAFLMKHDDMPHSNSQAVDNWFAAADTFEPYNMRVLSF